MCRLEHHYYKQTPLFISTRTQHKTLTPYPFSLPLGAGRFPGVRGHYPATAAADGGPPRPLLSAGRGMGSSFSAAWLAGM
jgi:hypothetical protein